ncbi:hypothetical protein [Nocardia arthritidis]|uniref:Uncharacterized protein n=1 Tax=Nocardia arthritidis TaxID=228602 RepID=A0A6G9YPT8_9NOCA|nr:hypothetical protein [Nocardia arthritidis]QIS14933.1 hypothetical protein F5544_35510 [Nocardia arthritidis]
MTITGVAFLGLRHAAEAQAVTVEQSGKGAEALEALARAYALVTANRTTTAAVPRVGTRSLVYNNEPYIELVNAQFSEGNS